MRQLKLKHDEPCMCDDFMVQHSHKGGLVNHITIISSGIEIAASLAAIIAKPVPCNTADGATNNSNTGIAS